MIIHRNVKFLQQDILDSHMNNWPKMYINGLKNYIYSEIKLWRPKNIEHARQSIKLIEQKKGQHDIIYRVR
jgi:hypothetical protein